jgi:WD40 repeat protein/serine/threonine protein kinase
MADRWTGHKVPAEEARPSQETSAGQTPLEHSRKSADELPPPEPARAPPLRLPGDKQDATTAASAQRTPAPIIPGYEILGELGRGGMGVVYQARQIALDRVVALKMIRAGDLASADDLARFRSEAGAVARLKHPNIVQIYEVGEHDGRPYFSLEFVEGGNLAQMANGMPQPPDPSAQLVQVLARAVHAAHQCGIIHRDLKPANILLAIADFRLEIADLPESRTPCDKSAIRNLQSAIPKIADFGLAKRITGDAGQTRTGQVMGTPSYMAPEQAAGKTREVGPAADVYSLGAILYELVTGRPPFLAESSEATRDLVLSQEPVPPRRLQPRLSRDLQTICLKCLDKQPHRRYATALELADELQRYLEGKPLRSRPVGVAERLWRWSLRKPAVAGLSVLAGLTVAAAIGFTLFTTRLSRDDLIREVNNAFDKGIALCEQGESSQGLLWLARSLELAPPDDDDLQWLIRGNLAGWRGQVSRLKAILSYENVVPAVAFSPDGGTIVTGCADGTAKFWDIARAKPMERLLAHQDSILSVAFSPNGKIVVTGSKDRTAQLWDVATRKAIGPELRHQDKVWAVAFSPDGKTVLTGSGDNTAQLWETATGKRRGPAFEHKRRLFSVAFSTDGNTVLTGSVDTAEFWDVHTGTAVGRALRHKGEVRTIAFSPDGKTVVTGSDERAQLWDVATGTPVGPPCQHSTAVGSVAFGSDPRVFLTGCDNVIRFWESGSGKPVGTPLYYQGTGNSVIFSADGRLVLTRETDRISRIWQMPFRQAPKVYLPHKKAVVTAAFSRDGKTVVTGSEDGTGQVWETATGRPRGRPLVHERPVVTVAYSPDGKRVLTGSWDNSAQQWDAATGEPFGRRLLHQDPVSAVAFDPVDGRILVTASWDNSAQLWHAHSGARHGEPLRHGKSVFAAAFSADGKSVLTGSADGTAQLWDATTGMPGTSGFQHPKPVHAVALSPDGKMVLTGSADATAQLWNALTGERLEPSLRHTELVFDVAFSPDGRSALTASWDKTARMWNVATRESHGIPMRHSGSVLSAAFSPDGRLVLTGSLDRTARLWDRATAKPFGPPLQHGALVRKVAFGPDSNLLVTACADNFGRIWEVPLPIKESTEKLALWAKVFTGMELDEKGRVRVLDAEGWDRYGRLLD